MNTFNFRTHFVYKNGQAIISRKKKVYLYDHKTNKKTILFTLKFKTWWKNYIVVDMLRRLFRLEIYHVLPLKNDNFVVFFDHRILNIENGRISHSFALRMRRPLKVYYNYEKTFIAWGEYDTSKTPHETCIYCSKDGGGTWEKRFCFSPGIIRHIHNIVFDEYRNKFWILTGDYDNEAGIWESTDLYAATPFLTGRQEFRAVEIVPDDNALLVPMDSEKERNYLHRYDITNSTLNKVLELPGSVFNFRKLADRYFLSTVVEPSIINNALTASLFVSSNGIKWEEYFQVKRSRLALRYFGYTQIGFPIYEDEKAPDMLYFNIINSDKGTFTKVVDINEFERE